MIKKKSLGQYFLKSPQVIDDMLKASKTEKNDLILEIGPGEGILTEALLKTGAGVISVEKDDRLIPELQKKFTREISLKQLDLIHADVLDLELIHIAKSPYKVVANIPYYITGQIIRMFLECDNQPRSITLLIQKEVAERIVGRDGKESLLSLSVKVFGNPKIIRTVGRGSFVPQPNVDSSIITIENISKEKLAGISEKKFFELIKAGFAYKRKQLLPNLSKTYGKMKTTQTLKTLSINPESRAEDLFLETWIKMCKTISV